MCLKPAKPPYQVSSWRKRRKAVSRLAKRQRYHMMAEAEGFISYPFFWVKLFRLHRYPVLKAGSGSFICLSISQFKFEFIVPLVFIQPPLQTKRGLTTSSFFTSWPYSLTCVTSLFCPMICDDSSHFTCNCKISENVYKYRQNEPKFMHRKFYYIVL